MSPRSREDEPTSKVPSTFGVVEMDGFEVVEPHLLVKLIQHGPDSALSGQVVACAAKGALPSGFASCCVATAVGSPAAKAWQVSRHTPTLLWSLTLSMMPLSSENLPPTVAPWPHMFSSTAQGGDAGITLTPPTRNYPVSHRRSGAALLARVCSRLPYL